MFESSKMWKTRSRVLECPRNTCRTVPSALLCRIMFTSRCHKENQKHPKKDIFSVLSISVCRTRPTKIRISVSQLYQRLRSMHMKGRFHDTPVQRHFLCIMSNFGCSLFTNMRILVGRVLHTGTESKMKCHI